MKFVLFLLALSLSSLVSPEDVNKVYMGIDSADQSKAEFALKLISQTLRNPRLSDSKRAARLFLNGDGSEILRAGSSPIEAQVSRLLETNVDFKIIACGKSFTGIRNEVRSGKAKLIPGVEFQDNCSSQQRSLKHGGWFEVEVPGME